MRVVRATDYQDMSRKAANIISAQLILKPDSVLGLSTGSTPEGAYAQLAEWCRRGDCSLSRARTFNLDEYVGLDENHPQSFHYFMRKKLFDITDIDLANTHIPKGIAPDLNATCADYDKLVEDLGFGDLVVLGIGNNGHVGFNEPDTYFSRGTHVVDLTESTIQANSRNFASADEVPRRAVTIGVQTVMYAHSLLMLASGEAKARAVRDMCFGPISPECPASILQLHHRCTVLADEAALSLCEAEL